jgi:AcrR family transcriptional regulator
MSVRDGASTPTEVSILRAASQLFAAAGYDGTTLEMVAEEAGVDERQVATFFPSTAAMMQSLIEHDIGQALVAVEAEVEGDGPAAVRLYRYLAEDVSWVVSSPYDLSGIDRVHLIQRPEFAAEKTKLERLRALRLALIRAAIDEGDLIRVSPEFAQESITSMIMGAIGERHGEPVERPVEYATSIADLAMRSLLRDPGRLDAIRRDAGFDAP